MKKRLVVKRTDFNVKKLITAAMSQAILVALYDAVSVSVVQSSLGSTDWTNTRFTWLAKPDSAKDLQLRLDRKLITFSVQTGL